MTNRVAFITGASSGIGAALALAFAREGTHVAAFARRADRLHNLQTTIAALPAPHGDLLALEGDVTDPTAVANAVAQTLAHFGRLDIAVANAGVGQRGAIAEAEWSDLQTLLRTNIDGVLHTVRATVPALRQTGKGGHVFIISSVMYNLPSPYAATYGASKAFVSSIAASLRLELESDQIAVTDVLVGRTDTEFNEKRLGAGKRSGGGLPTMQPEIVAQAIVQATRHRPNRLILRFFDRLIVLGNILLPAMMGRLAKRQYQ